MSTSERILKSAQALFLTSQYEAAAKVLEKHLETGQADLEAYLLLARVYWNHSDHKAWERAAEVLELATKLFPDDIRPLLQLADTLAFHLNRYEDALLVYEKVLELDPNNVGTHQGIAALYPWGVTADRAIEHLKKIIEIDPEVQDVYTGIASIYWQQGDNEKALHWYQEALKHNVLDRDGVQRRIEELKDRLSQHHVPE